MKNRAKCRLCEDIIESFHSTDYISCKCGEIALDGGDSLKCYAKDWSNLLRIDDKGNTIFVTVKNEEKKDDLDLSTKPTKKELLDILDEMIKSFERLPQEAMSAPITHYDLLSSLLLISSIFRSFDNF